MQFRYCFSGCSKHKTTACGEIFQESLLWPKPVKHILLCNVPTSASAVHDESLQQMTSLCSKRVPLYIRRLQFANALSFQKKHSTTPD